MTQTIPITAIFLKEEHIFNIDYWGRHLKGAKELTVPLKAICNKKTLSEIGLHHPLDGITNPEYR